MKPLKGLPAALRPPVFRDQEATLVSGIIWVIAIAIGIGLMAIVIERATVQQWNLSMMAGTMVCLQFYVLLLVRKGHLRIASFLLLSTLLLFILLLMFVGDGLHDAALVGIPGVIVISGIILRGRMFFPFTVFTVGLVGLFGHLEVSRVIRNRHSWSTNYLDVLDVMIILSATAASIYMLSRNLLKSFRQAEQRQSELRESEEKFRTLADKLPNMVFINKAGRVVYVNEKCEQVLGWPRDHFYAEGFDFLTLIAPKHRQLVRDKFVQRMRGEELPPYEYSMIRHNGEIVDCIHMSTMISYEGSPAVLGIVTEITHIKRAEEELRESQNLLSGVVTSAMDAIVAVDEQYHIQMFNPASEAIFGCSAAVAAGEPISRFIPDPFLESGKGSLRNAAGTFGEGMTFGSVGRLYGLRSGGERFPVEVSWSRVAISEKRIYTIIVRDISERVKSEQATEALQSQLLQAQKMEAVGTLAGGIAHDFNNLLSAILGNAELAKTRLPVEDPSVKYVDRILVASERGRELVKQIMAFSRKKESERKPVRLHDIVAEAVKLLRSSLPMTIDIRTTLPTVGPAIIGDPTQLHQVIMNLCTNAAYAMEGGGTLTISLENIEATGAGWDSPHRLAPGQYQQLVVTDTGHGMGPNTLKRIFEPFFTTKGPGKGTGLGLSVVHGIVKSHGGVIAVRSEEGKGTTFELYFPTTAFSPEEGTETGSTLPQGHGELLLVVDDEMALGDLVSAMATDLGYQVAVFSDPRAAIEEFRTDPGRVKLVISDLTMPHMTGMVLAERLKQIRSDCPIVVMSGYDQVADPSRMASLGIRAVLQKPFTLEEFAVTVAKVFAAH